MEQIIAIEAIKDDAARALREGRQHCPYPLETEAYRLWQEAYAVLAAQMISDLAIGRRQNRRPAEPLERSYG